MNTTHIVLLGDSIFDNRAYTGADADVVTHLRGLLPDAARATLLAVDGHTTSGIAAQSARIPQMRRTWWCRSAATTRSATTTS